MAASQRLARWRSRLARLPLSPFRPVLLDALRDYDRDRLVKDVSAGVTVGIVALPLAMALGIASGVKPEQAIFTAIIGGFLISAFGGSRVQIGGPAAAFVVIIYGIIERYGFANLVISTMFAGVLLFAMGLTGLGYLIRFIPVSIVIGFTSGIAVLIIVSQLRDFLGLAIDRMPADFFQQAHLIVESLGSANVYAIGVGAASLALIVIWPKLYLGRSFARWQRVLAHVPGPIVALIVGSSVVALLNLPVETIGSKFGGIPRELPPLQLPEFSWELVKQLVAPTITIALLGAIESLLCARIADKMIDDRHDSNQELMAQGIANVVTPLFGGIPATGTIARTMTNVRSGGTSPIAGIVHALTLLSIVLIAAPLASSVPLATLAAILIVVGVNMGEWREFVRLRRFPVTYRTILLATFLLTVIFDLTVAVQVGMVLASLFFIYRISQITRIEPIELSPGGAPAGVEAYRLFGSLFFGAVSKLETLINPARYVGAHAPHVIVLDLALLISLDTTGVEALDTLRTQLVKRGGTLILAAPHEQPMSMLARSGFIERVGADNVVADLPAALARAGALAASA